MAAKSKAAKQSKTRRTVKAANAKRDRKIDAKQATLTRTEQAHRISAVMASGPVSIDKLAEKSGCSVARVTNHVNYEISKKRAELKNKLVKQLVKPAYRAAE